MRRELWRFRERKGDYYIWQLADDEPFPRRYIFPVDLFWQVR